MSDDYGQKLDGEYRQRARVSYIREHAHHVASALVGGMVSPTGMVKATGAAIAQSAVEITGALHDALPPDPDQGQDGGSAPSGWERAQRPAQGLVEEHTVPADLDEGPALPEIPPLPSPAPLLPVELEITTRATAAPTCTCTGQQPCSAACRRCVPERRQSAGPEEATHADRPPRRPVSERLARLADCQNSTDAAAIAAYHAHLASSNIQMCGACGAQLDIAVVPDCRPGLPVRRMQPYGLRSRPPAGAMLTLVSVNAGRTNVAYLAAEKPGQGPDPLRAGGAAMKALQSLRGFLHPRLAFSLGTALMGFLLLVAGYPRYALTYFGLSVLGVAVAAVLKRWRR